MNDPEAEKVIKRETARLSKEASGVITRNNEFKAGHFYEFLPIEKGEKFTAEFEKIISGSIIYVKVFRKGKLNENLDDFYWRDYNVREVARELAYELSLID